jgi:hypothetical protein
MQQVSATLSLPYIQPAQAQKHVTHNEALRILDAVTQLSVLDATLTAPPATVSEGDRYIVANGATGAWAGEDAALAIWIDSTWHFFAPGVGWRADDAGSGDMLRFDGTDWQNTDGPLDLQNLPSVGIGTTADNTNRLSVSADATLLNNAGNGHQLKVNKATAGDTASLLFQTGFSGRAEMGTAGSDDFAIKVSADGSAFHTALQFDAVQGSVQVKSGQTFFEDVYIASDSVWSTDIPWSDPSRILMWLCTDAPGQFSILAITGTLTGAGNFADLISNPPGSVRFLTGALTGTTGLMNGINMSIDTSGSTPRLYVENRLGSGHMFTLATLGR